jgi:hypothetical protein
MPKKKHIIVKVNGIEHKTELISDVQRFIENKAITSFIDAANDGIKRNLNDVWLDYYKGLYTKEEMRELYRLMGYSVCGYDEIFGTSGMRTWKPADKIENPLWDK